MDPRLDIFLKKQGPDPDAIIKSVPVDKIGWTDEAREAAAAARSHGFGWSHSEQDSKGNLTRHLATPADDRQRVSIDNKGNWKHSTSGFPSGSGKGGESLHQHLGAQVGSPEQDDHDSRLASAKTNRPLSTPERHQHKIAQQTLRMSPAMAGVMGGPNHHEARQILSRNTGLPAYPGQAPVGGAKSPYENPNSPQSRAAGAASRAAWESQHGASRFQKDAYKVTEDAEPEESTQQYPGYRPKGVEGEMEPPPTPRVIVVDGDQDSIAHQWSSDDRTESYRPGQMETDSMDDLMQPCRVQSQEEALANIGVNKEAFRPTDPTGMLTSGTGLPRQARKGEIPPGILSGDPVLHDDEDESKKKHIFTSKDVSGK